YTVTRTYTLKDAALNPSTCQQIITVNDNMAPTATTAAGSLDRTVECSDGAGLAAALALAPAATDNCTASPTIRLCSDVPTPHPKSRQIMNPDSDDMAPTMTTAARSHERTEGSSDAASAAAPPAPPPAATDN